MEMTLERVGMPLEQFLEEQTTQPFELIDGEKVINMPTVFRHSDIIHLIYDLVRDACRLTKSGSVLMETTFIMPDTFNSNWVVGSRVPDVMIYANDRISQWRKTMPHNRPLDIVPDLVIEILSPNDKSMDVQHKVKSYLSDGVKKVIVLDPENHEAWVYNAEGGVFVRADGTLDLSDTIPDLKLRMADIFAE